MLKVSVIIPCFNSANTIDACLASVFQQTLQEIEIIVVDDGSQDDSAAILQQKYSGRITRLVHPENKGVSTSRNDGLAAATGRYVTFLDADDQLLPDFCEMMFQRAEQQQAEIVCCTWKRTTGANPEVTHAVPSSLPGETIISGYDFLGKSRWSSFFDSSCCKLYKLDFLRAHGLRFPEEMTYGEDTCFANQAASLAQRIVLLERYQGYLYFNNPASCMNTIPVRKRLDNLEKLLWSLQKALPANNGSPLLRKSTEYLWTIKKYGSGQQRELFQETLNKDLWHVILYPVISRHGKWKHRFLLHLLSKGCLLPLRFW